MDFARYFHVFILTISLSTIAVSNLSAQEEDEPELDISKPTNFYTFLDNNLETTFTDGANIYGYRANLTLSIDERNLMLIEAPLLYNDASKTFGIGDLRTRYFYLPYKDYSKLFGAFGPSVDIFIPTGNAENGLGSGRWVIAPGVTAGLMVSETIQFFPVLSYQYVSKSNLDSIPDSENESLNGVSFQVITPIVISERFFTQITPVLALNDFREDDSFRYSQEVLLSYGIKPTLWANLFYRGTFEDDIHTIRLGITIYL